MDTFRASSRRGSGRDLVKKSLLFIAIIALLVGLYFFNRQFLRVTSIVCQAAGEPCPEAIQSLVDTYKGQSLLLLRQRDLSRDIVATGLADTVRVSVHLPGRLIVNFTPPSTSFYLASIFGTPPPTFSFETATDSSQVIPPSVELDTFIATSEAIIFRLLPSGVLDQSATATNYYLITQSIPTREYLQFAFTWLKAISQANLSPQTVYFLPTLLIISVSDQPNYLFNFATDPIASLTALQRLSSAVTIRELRVIDFRYTNPILK